MFLKKLEIYGLEGIEDFILTGLVTGDPVLLVGDIGSAKTLLCRRLAEALNLNFRSYDASKALFEDVIGFPDPSGFEKGKIDYVPTPLSIWDAEFLLIDEVSRADPQMQNKWLEIIREREVMGERIKNLKYVLGAMNPPGYLGTNYLDRALAGRFAMIVEVPNVRVMNKNDIGKIIISFSEKDAPMLKRKGRKKTNVRLLNFIKKCQRDFEKVEMKFRREINEYITSLVYEFKNTDLSIDGRRASMIYRNIVALITVKQNKGAFDKAHLPGIFYQALAVSLPHRVTGENFNPKILEIVHMNCLEKLGKQIFPVSLSKNKEIYNEETLHNLLNTIESSPSDQDLRRNITALLQFLQQVLSGEKKAKKGFVSSCQKILVEKSFLHSLPENVFSVLEYQDDPDLNKGIDSLALRLAIAGLDAGYGRGYVQRVKELEELINNYKRELRKIFKKEE